MAAMQVEHCFHCAHHTMESDRDRSLRTVLLANEIRKRKRQTPLEVVAPLHVYEQQQQQVYLPPVATLVQPHHHQPQQQHHLVVVDPTPVTTVINNKRQRVTINMDVIRQHLRPVAAQRVREEKERAKRSERRVRITMKRATEEQQQVGTAAEPIVVVDDDDEEVIASGHIAAAVREVAAQRETEQQQRLKNVIAAGLLHNPADRPLGAATATATAPATTAQEPHVYDLYFSKESLGAIVHLVSEWIRQYDPSSYAIFTKEDRETWIISLVQMIVQILNWRLNNFFSSYARCFKIESFPNLFSKNFKADTSRVGVDKLAKKWQKRNYELLLATLMYADRYVRARGIKDVSLFHLLAISSLCTIKHWLEERNRHANRLFADVLGLTVQQVNALERTFLGGLNYSLSLAPEDFPHFLLAQIQRSAAKRA